MEGRGVPSTVERRSPVQPIGRRGERGVFVKAPQTPRSSDSGRDEHGPATKAARRGERAEHRNVPARAGSRNAGRIRERAEPTQYTRARGPLLDGRREAKRRNGASQRQTAPQRTQQGEPDPEQLDPTSSVPEHTTVNNSTS